MCLQVGVTICEGKASIKHRESIGLWIRLLVPALGQHLEVDLEQQRVRGQHAPHDGPLEPVVPGFLRAGAAPTAVTVARPPEAAGMLPD